MRKASHRAKGPDISLRPQPLKALPTAVLRGVDTLFFDIDDTFSSHGQITAEAFEALWRLKRAGLKCVAVTGRPAGWCDMIARMWPVTAVVGENGAFYTLMRRGRLEKAYLEPSTVRLANQKRLEHLRQSLQRAFPGHRLASDQAFREFDLAIDYREDVKPWPKARVQRLLAHCRAQGALALLSSIHVNTWFGRYDKLTCVKKLGRELWGRDFATLIRTAVYTGDSPNDEPFFAAFPLSVGVANVRDFLDDMAAAPAFITRRECGAGFSELASRLAAARKK